jgi:peptidyl-prolyl cis-trans isomerase C
MIALAGVAAAADKTEAKPAETKPAATDKAPAKSENGTSAAEAAGPAAKVNGVEIPRSELDRATRAMLSQNQVPPQAMTPDLTKQFKDAALSQLVAAELLYQEGKKRDFKDRDKQVDERLAKYRSSMPSQEEFDKALKNAGMTMDDLKTIATKEVTISNIIDNDLKNKVTVSDADAQKFYDDNKDKFVRAESVRASHILVGLDQKATDEDKKKAKEKAEALLKQVKEGKDFAELAKTNSTCPSSAQGGDLGYFGKGQMVKPFEDAAFALKTGETSGIVETQFGYHIIKLTDKKPAETVKLAEAKDKIVDYLKQQKLQQAITDYVETLKKTAKIEILDK